MNYSLCTELQGYLSRLKRNAEIEKQISQAESELKKLHVVSEDEYVGTFYTEEEYIRKHVKIRCPSKPELIAKEGTRILIIWLLVLIVCCVGIITEVAFSSWLTLLLVGIAFIVSLYFTFMCVSAFIGNVISSTPEMIAYRKTNKKYQTERKKLQNDYQQYRAMQTEDQERKRIEYRNNPARFEQEFHDKTVNLQNRIEELKKEKDLNEMTRHRYEMELEIPLKYSSTDSLKQLLSILEDGRADNIKEAINVYEHDKEIKQQTEYARLQTAIQYEKMKQAQNDSQQLASLLRELQDESANTAEENNKATKRRGTEQCNHCKRYLTCSHKYSNDTGLCTGFVPTDSFF